MKTKQITLLFLLIVPLLAKSQEYKIDTIYPDYLHAGENNHLTIFIDTSIMAYDSVSVLIYEYSKDGLTDIHHAWQANSYDTAVNAVVYIPETADGKQGELHLELINTHDWTTNDVVYEYRLPIGENIFSIVPKLCMVNVNDNDKNEIIWEPSYPEYVDSIIVYKETSVAEEFLRIGALSVTQQSVFVDESSQNAPNSYRYKIAFKDTVGNISKMSTAHKTMHLTMNLGVDGTINLIWEKYEGFHYSTFHIYRGSSKDNLMKIAEIASNLFTFSDQNPSIFRLYYQVVIENPTPCNVPEAKSTETTYATTKSNFVEHTLNSTDDVEAGKNLLEVWPNPVYSKFFIELDNAGSDFLSIELRDINGRIIFENVAITNGSDIDLGGIKSGIYNLQVVHNEKVYNKTLVKN